MYAGSSRRPRRRATHPGRPSAGRHHVADQLVAGARIRAHHRRPPAHVREPRAAPPRSRRARSGGHAASPGSRCGPGTPARPSGIQRTRSPVRYIRSPSHRTGRRRTAPRSGPARDGSRGPAARPRGTAHPRTPAGTGRSRRPARRPACSTPAHRSGTAPRVGVGDLVAGDVDRGLGGTVQVVQRRTGRLSVAPPASRPATPRRWRTPAAARPRRRQVGSLTNTSSIDGTKCTRRDTAHAAITSARYAGSRCPSGAAITRRAPTSNGQNNSHTDTSNVARRLLQHRSSDRQPVLVAASTPAG